ncbi:coiled-coil domain-containing protein 174 [Anopheles maculipalpis]|uniref:coiled-coil domain-containing protein 174 n=1 Tax=Anopheles maculipalpis TaxID=1496333 RepID=UPI002159734F|nr:coiled-coil domain-containing protein 174 [Anopheles maculipalpis]
MNDPNRKIEIDKSSLLSLKAELLRKQEEVGRAKASTSIEDFVPKKVPKPEKDASSARKERREKQDKSKPIVTELEDSAQLARSKQMLQAKAKYYDRMVAAGGSLNSDENSLVMFNKKKQDTKPAYTLSNESPRESSASSSSSESEDEGGDNKWVEYTDCLGRTRKCLKEDLKSCLARDRELAKSMEPRDGQRREDMQQGPAKVKEPVDSAKLEKIIDQQEAVDDEEGEEGEIVGPMPPSMGQIGGTDIGERFREMKEQWAEQEEANLEKESIHYQDVLFDEARLHGVGYYAFSTDQQERNRQRDELDSIRESTLEAQKERETLRKARDKLIADRVKAARARQRARQGLPPEAEDDAEQSNSKATESADQLFDSVEQKRQRKAEEKQRKKKEREERRRERERADHVRPWDEGKEQRAEDKEWVPAKERFVLSQHEWNEMKRSERIAEFAPPPSGRPFIGGGTGTQRSPDRDSASDSDVSDSEETVVGPLPPTMMTHSEPVPEDIPLPEEEDPARRSLFFTTKKNPPKKELKRRNLNAVEMVLPTKKQSTPVPIVNELCDAEVPDGERECPVPERRGVEIEPPATYDYYGPVDGAGGHRRQGGRGVAPENRSNLEASIEAGLKFLRNQSDKSGGPGTKNRWTSNADY